MVQLPISKAGPLDYLLMVSIPLETELSSLSVMMVAIIGLLNSTLWPLLLSLAMMTVD